jgi:hypothetical protein
VNLYGFVGNRGICKWDLLGAGWFDDIWNSIFNKNNKPKPRNQWVEVDGTIEIIGAWKLVAELLNSNGWAPMGPTVWVINLEEDNLTMVFEASAKVTCKCVKTGEVVKADGIRVASRRGALYIDGNSITVEGPTNVKGMTSLSIKVLKTILTKSGKAVWDGLGDQISQEEESLRPGHEDSGDNWSGNESPCDTL